MSEQDGAPNSATTEPLSTEPIIHPAPSRRGVPSRVLRAAAEFLLIVTGVLTALAIETWNNGRLDLRRERIYLESLEADIQSQVELFDRWLSGYDRRMAVAEALWRVASTGSTESFPADSLFAAISSGGNYTPPRRFRDATYQELLSTGTLQLLRNQDLRAQLIDYYAVREQNLAWMDASANAAEVRWNAVADELVPSSVQRAFYDDPYSLQPSDLDSAVRALSQERVKQAIMYMLSMLRDAQYFARDSRERADQLWSGLQRELSDVEAASVAVDSASVDLQSTSP